LGVTVGFHRLLTHRSFATYKPIAYALAIAGSMAVQGPVISWVADHRKHHAHTDEEGDPHSPHVGHGAGVVGSIKGLWWAHLGWLLDRHGQADPRRYARDLREDAGMRRINAAFPFLVVAGLMLPFVAGFVIAGTLAGAATALLWGGFVRVFILHHVTWSVNSVCHFFGRRRFDTDDESTNVTWVALLSFGEGWHHNHHAFPRSAKHGLRWYEPDVFGLDHPGARARRPGLERGHDHARAPARAAADHQRLGQPRRAGPGELVARRRISRVAAAITTTNGPKDRPFCLRSSAQMPHSPAHSRGEEGEFRWPPRWTHCRRASVRWSGSPGSNDRTDSWMNTWAFQARRELRRRRRKMPATQSRGRPQPSG
jgi:stearoyl-CoA desaturase (delta-9 desaturase)